MVRVAIQGRLAHLNMVSRDKIIRIGLPKLGYNILTKKLELMKITGVELYKLFVN